MTEVTKVQFPKPSDKQASRFDRFVFSKDDERALKFVQSPGAGPGACAANVKKE